MIGGRFRLRPRASNKKITQAFLCLLLAWLPLSCGKISEETRLIDRFRHMADLAEDEDTAKIMEAFSAKYTDFEGRDKAATEKMIREYFGAYRGIVLHVLGVRVTAFHAEEASLEADVAFSSGAAQVLRRLARLGGEYYRIEIRWVKEDGVWLAAYAEWRQIGSGDLFPESLDKLQNILPID